MTTLHFSDTEWAFGGSGSSVDISFIGGTYADTAVRVSGMPSFEPGYRYLLLLSSHNDPHVPFMAGEHGAWQVVTSNHGDELLVNSRGEVLLETGTGSNYPFSANIGGKVQVTESAREGARDSYPYSGGNTDLGLSILRRKTAAGDTGFIPANTNGINEVIDVNRGDYITRAYCVHNLGTTTETTTMKIYLSTDDDIIETTDTVLGAFSFTVSADEPYCPTRSVQIPSGAPVGSHRIGAIIDPSDTISEIVENNNIARDSRETDVN